MAFAIGAVSVQSVLKYVYFFLDLYIVHYCIFSGSYPQQPAFNASLNSVTAASITWAEMELGVQYSFGIANTSEPDYAAYIAPVPLDLSTTTSARWLTDVIGINPMCSWAPTNITTLVQVPVNSTSDINEYFATAYLLDLNLDVQVTASDIRESFKLGFWLFLFLFFNVLSPSRGDWGDSFCRCQRPHLRRDQPHYTGPRLRRINGIPSGPMPIWLPHAHIYRHHAGPDGHKYYLYDRFD